MNLNLGLLETLFNWNLIYKLRLLVFFLQWRRRATVSYVNAGFQQRIETERTLVNFVPLAHRVKEKRKLLTLLT